MKNQEQLVKDNQRAVYKQQMKQNLEMLEPEAKFWEAQFKALYYKNEFAKLQAEITQQMQMAQQEMTVINKSNAEDVAAADGTTSVN